MEITQTWLENIDACEGLKDWFKAQTETDGLKLVKKLIKEKKLDWANWLIVHIMTYEQYTTYAIYAAKLVLPIFKKHYPNDKKLNETIEATEKFSKNPTEENKLLAKKAASTAASADAIATAIYAASTFYAVSAASAFYAANAASANAADAESANKKILIDILNYGLGLLEK